MSMGYMFRSLNVCLRLKELKVPNISHKKTLKSLRVVQKINLIRSNYLSDKEAISMCFPQEFVQNTFLL